MKYLLAAFLILPLIACDKAVIQGPGGAGTASIEINGETTRITGGVVSDEPMPATTYTTFEPTISNVTFIDNSNGNYTMEVTVNSTLNLNNLHIDLGDGHHVVVPVNIPVADHSDVCAIIESNPEIAAGFATNGVVITCSDACKKAASCLTNCRSTSTGVNPGGLDMEKFIPGIAALSCSINEQQSYNNQTAEEFIETLINGNEYGDSVFDLFGWSCSTGSCSTASAEPEFIIHVPVFQPYIWPGPVQVNVVSDPPPQHVESLTSGTTSHNYTIATPSCPLDVHC